MSSESAPATHARTQPQRFGTESDVEVVATESSRVRSEEKPYALDDLPK